MTRLWHYTCHHGDVGIRRSGIIRPHLGLVWLTDLGPDSLSPSRVRAACGLTSTILTCDSMTYCFEVDASDALPWREFVRQRADDEAFARKARMLEAAPRVRPSNWYVSTRPVRLALGSEVPC